MRRSQVVTANRQKCMRMVRGWDLRAKAGESIYHILSLEPFQICFGIWAKTVQLNLPSPMTFWPPNWRKAVLIQILRPLSFSSESFARHWYDNVSWAGGLAALGQPKLSLNSSHKTFQSLSSYQWNAVSRAMEFFPTLRWVTLTIDTDIFSIVFSV